MSEEMPQYGLRNNVHAETVDKLVKDLKDSDFCNVTLVHGVLFSETSCGSRHKCVIFCQHFL